MQYRVTALAPEGDNVNEVPKDRSLPGSRGLLMLGCLAFALQAASRR